MYDYKIIKSIIEFDALQKLKRVVVFVEISDNDIRSIEANNVEVFGCMTLKNRKTDELNYEFLQEVAAFGNQISNALFDKLE